MRNLEKTKTHLGKLVNKIEHCIYIPCLDKWISVGRALNGKLGED